MRIDFTLKAFTPAVKAFATCTALTAIFSKKTAEAEKLKASYPVPSNKPYIFNPYPSTTAIFILDNGTCFFVKPLDLRGRNWDEFVQNMLGNSTKPIPVCPLQFQTNVHDWFAESEWELIPISGEKIADLLNYANDPSIKDYQFLLINKQSGKTLFAKETSFKTIFNVAEEQGYAKGYEEGKKAGQKTVNVTVQIQQAYLAGKLDACKEGCPRH